jgi:hypothetical protein
VVSFPLAFPPINWKISFLNLIWKENTDFCGQFKLYNSKRTACDKCCVVELRIELGTAPLHASRFNYPHRREGLTLVSQTRSPLQTYLEGGGCVLVIKPHESLRATWRVGGAVSLSLIISGRQIFCKSVFWKLSYVSRDSEQFLKGSAVDSEMFRDLL